MALQSSNDLRAQYGESLVPIFTHASGSLQGDFAHSQPWETEPEDMPSTPGRSAAARSSMQPAGTLRTTAHPFKAAPRRLEIATSVTSRFWNKGFSDLALLLTFLIFWSSCNVRNKPSFLLTKNQMLLDRLFVRRRWLHPSQRVLVHWTRPLSRTTIFLIQSVDF